MLFDIFKTFFKIGAFTIGGGYAMIPIIQKEVVDNKSWMENEEFLDSIAVTNSLPGPLAINTATFVGYKTAGIKGAIAAALGAVMPSFIIILIISAFFSSFGNSAILEQIFAGIRPAVVALIAYALVKLAKSAGITKINIAIGLTALTAILFINLHPIVVIILAGIAGVFIFKGKEESTMLIKLFIAFIKIGAFSFGGGYGVLAFMQKEIIESNNWINMQDFTNIVAIAEMTPGPIAVNASTFVGYKLSGFVGSSLATFGVILVPFALSLLVSIYFNKFKHLMQINWILKGIRPAVLGLIAAASINIGKISFVDFNSVVIGVLVFIGVYRYKINPILALVLSGVMGVLVYGVMA
ncbi:MAG: hypothetical protein A2Y23_11490 [Clostridiales bacterium GWB2_37_7]|nr:MAG: hypothetical protein A2Y23_11490 [Clostridiales bacterium GWB2_37_7]